MNGGNYIYTSTDYGATWTKKNSPEPRVAGLGRLSSIVSSSDGTKLLSTNLLNLYTSTDSGTTWTKRAHPTRWGGIASSSDGTKLVAGEGNGSIYTSTNSGETWTQRIDGSTSGYWKAFASSADGTKLVTATVGGSEGGSIYYSINSGVSWIQSSAGAGRWPAFASSSDGSKIFTSRGGRYYNSTDGGKIITSNNYGANWQELTGGIGNGNWDSIAISSDGSKLLTGNSTGGYIYTSKDSGASWQEVTAIGTRRWTAFASSSDGTKLVAANYGGFIYYSTDSGLSWTDSQTQPTTYVVVSTLSAPAGVGIWNGFASDSTGTKLVTGNGNKGYIYTSTDSGISWIKRAGTGIGNWNGFASSSDGTKLVTGDGNKGYIYTSTDSGISWIKRTSAGTGSWNAFASSADGAKLVTGDSYFGYIYTSADSGISWTARTGPGIGRWQGFASSADGTKLVTGNYGGDLVTASNGEQFVSSGDAGGYIYTSTNYGETWTQRTGAGKRSWTAFASSSDGTKLVTGHSNYGYIYTSTDSGETWTERRGARKGSWYGFASDSTGTNLVTGNHQNGYIYTSADSGETWTKMTFLDTGNWTAFASSANGTKLVTGINGGYIYTSDDSGATWRPSLPQAAAEAVITEAAAKTAAKNAAKAAKAAAKTAAGVIQIEGEFTLSSLSSGLEGDAIYIGSALINTSGDRSWNFLSQERNITLPTSVVNILSNEAEKLGIPYDNIIKNSWNIGNSESNLIKPYIRTKPDDRISNPITRRNEQTGIYAGYALNITIESVDTNEDNENSLSIYRVGKPNSDRSIKVYQVIRGYGGFVRGWNSIIDTKPFIVDWTEKNNQDIWPMLDGNYVGSGRPFVNDRYKISYSIRPSDIPVAITKGYEVVENI